MGILDKVITVVHRSGGNDCGDEDISDMGDGESHRRIGRRGRDEVRNEGRGGSRGGLSMEITPRVNKVLGGARRV